MLDIAGSAPVYPSDRSSGRFLAGDTRYYLAMTTFLYLRPLKAQEMPRLTSSDMAGQDNNHMLYHSVPVLDHVFCAS